MPTSFITGWQTKTLSDLARIGSGSAYSGPVRAGSFDMMGANGPIGKTDRPNFGPGYLVGRVGAAGSVNFAGGPCWASDNTLTVVPRDGICELRFLGHLLEHLRPERLATRNAQPLVTQTSLGGLRADLPTDIREQRLIARILDTLDEAIRKTEQLIAKLKLVKQGLLHDLLTRGIDENGELRDPERHPEQFKESELGRIPREWGASRVGDLAEVAGGVTLGRNLAGPSVIELPYLRVANVQDGYLDLTEIKTVPILASEESRFQLLPGDVLMNEGGDFDKLGRGTVWEGQVPRCLHQNHVFRVRCLADRLRPWYLAYVSESFIGKSYFVRCSKQTTNLATINSTQIKAFQVPVPPSAEQDRIASILKSVGRGATVQAEQARKLSLLKSALSDDLLTGRVRVTPLLAAAP